MKAIKEMDKQGLLKRNFDRPPLKDTVTVPVGGYTIIRFLTNNPGTWLFHCHLEFHSEIGMAFMVRVGQTKDLPSLPKNWPQCGNYEFSGNGASKSTATTEKTVIFFVGLLYALLPYF